MIYSEKFKFLFLAVPKTGTTFVERILVDLCKGLSDDTLTTPNPKLSKKVGIYKKHDELKKVKDVDFNNKFSFAFTRNPYDRVVSWYSYLTQKLNNEEERQRHIEIYGKKFLSGDFTDFVKYAPDWVTQSSLDWCVDAKHNRRVDFVGKYENFNDDLEYVLKNIFRSELSFVDFMRLCKIDEWAYNSSKHKKYTEYYTSETKKIIQNKCAKELNYFKYEF